jgi:hypothetical protein
VNRFSRVVDLVCRAMTTETNPGIEALLIHEPFLRSLSGAILRGDEREETQREDPHPIDRPTPRERARGLARHRPTSLSGLCGFGIARP